MNKLANLGLCLVVGSVMTLLSNAPDTKASESQQENEEAYLHGVNSWLTDSKARAVPQNETASEVSNIYWRFVSAISETKVQYIEFHGKVMDQNGLPVANAVIEFEAASSYLTQSSGVSRVLSDNDGTFVTEGALGNKSLSIRSISKPGYVFEFGGSNINRFDHFQRFNDSVVWKRFTQDNPYVFTLWKLGEPIKNAKDGPETAYAFIPDGRPYTFDLIDGGKDIFKRGIKEGQLRANFVRSEEGWTLELVVPEGGLVEAGDIYLLEAPEEGYVQSVMVSLPKDQGAWLDKSFFVKLNGGKVYGVIKLRINGYHRQYSAMYLSYTLNLDGGRNLTVKR
ncbi:hypothetical protein [Aurantivibrio plasticivorans]